MLNSKFYDIVKFGTIYRHAVRNIQCDRCYKNELNICMTFKDSDLCLECVDILSEEIYYNKDINPYRPDILLKMEQKIYNPSINNINQDILIDNVCLTSYPCKHALIINGKKTNCISGTEIAEKYWKYLNSVQRKHFEKYLTNNFNYKNIYDK
jgi:hypothetical protein